MKLRPSLGGIRRPSPSPEPPPRDDAAANTLSRKKSSCVREVERLQRNREQRRAQQQQLRERRAQVVDTSLPNWEFAEMISNFRSSLDFSSLVNDTEPVEDHRICVCVRKRPLNKKELSQREIDVVSVVSRDTAVVHEPRVKVDLSKMLENQRFRFDVVFNEYASNQSVYR
ncbi:kinesin-like protein KIF2A, partial [Lampetra fluviatilis]